MPRIQVGGGTKALLTSDAIPPSKVHADPQPPAYDWSLFTINGQSIPEALWPQMNYHLTDQAAAERASKEGPKPVTTVLRDEADKQTLDSFKDGLEEGNQLRGRDPLGVAMAKYLPKGMRGLWIGQKKAQEMALVRGGLEYVPVMIDDDDVPGKKKKVMQGGMFLAMVTEEEALREERYNAQFNEEKQQLAIERVQEQSDKLLSQQGMDRLARKKRMDTSLISGDIIVDESEAADRELEMMGAHEVGSD